MVTLEELRGRESKIHVGDMVLFNFNCADTIARRDPTIDRRLPTTLFAGWSRRRRSTSVGSDASGIELKGVANQPNHQFLMDHQVPIIEFAANLDQLRQERFTLLVLAFPVVGLDSCPVRLVAIEDEWTGGAA